MGSFLVAFAAVSRQELVGLALGSRWGRPSPLAEPLLQQVGPPNGKHQSTGFRASLDHFWAAEGRQGPSGTRCRVYFPLSYVQGAPTGPVLCLFRLGFWRFGAGLGAPAAAGPAGSTPADHPWRRRLGGW